MKFSIITVTYNCVKTIEKTIQSVLGQNYKNVEYIIVDGASVDGTKEVIEKYRDRIDIYISEPDDGVYDAMNKALSYASGDAIEFMNGDDYFVDDTVLGRVAELFAENPDAELISGLDQLGIASSAHYPDKYQHIYIDAVFSHQALFARKQVFDDIGLFDKSYQVCADREWICRAWYQKKKFLLADDVFVYYAPGGISAGGKTAEEFYRIGTEYLKKCGEEQYLEKLKDYCVSKIKECLFLEQLAEWKDEPNPEQVEKWLGKEHDFVLWGCGTYGALFYEVLTANGKGVNKFIDSKYQDEKYCSCPVIRYTHDRIDYKLLVSTKNYDKEITAMLEKEGYVSERDFYSFSTLCDRALLIGPERKAERSFYEATGIVVRDNCL